jgi:hypothetical protein
MRTLGLLFLTLILIFVAGLALNWWSVSTETYAGTDGRKVSVGINEGEIEKDTARVREGAAELGERIGDTFKDRDLTGVVTALRPETAGLTVADEETTYELSLAEGAVIEVGDEVSTLAEVRVGDRVSVELESKDQRRVRRLRVKR